ncbi:hypothetical protein RND81_03G069000 [Saponaria officinalis]|uniref:PHD-type domain-containing protein n=1 Tax=Saponaria officinalis TaxID=3572 RepID=A0AAW1M5K6_SAPOF
MGKKQQFQGNCCYVCGHIGYKELLVECAECNQLSIHKYCLGVTPGSDEDKAAYWICCYCSPQSMDSKTNDQISNVDTTSNLKQCDNQIVLIKEQPEPLCTLFPEGHYIFSKVEEAAEIVSGVVLIVSPSGEAIIRDDIDRMIWINEEIMSKKVVKKVVMNSCNDDVKNGKVRRSSERIKDKSDKLDMIGFRRSPRFKKRKIMHGSNTRVCVC